MHVGRILVGGAPCLARIEGDEAIPLTGDLFGSLRETGRPLRLHDVEFMAPVVPSKVIGVGSNYRKHAAEMGKPVPDEPRLFIKPSTAVVGPGAAIAIPPRTQRVDHEAELAVVVGRTLFRGSEHTVLDHVLGYTCCNDVTARDFQQVDGQFTRAKGFDGFCPLGPWVTTGIDPSDLAVRAFVDGELRQDGRTSDMVFGVRELLVFISGIMTLYPGDVIATGTPSGVGPVRAGQRVVVEVEGIGRLENPVVDRDDRASHA